MVFKADKRKKLLDAHNKLRNILQYADDFRTLEMRHLGDMENIIFMLSHEFQFKPQRDDEGNVKYYSDWVMGKIDGYDWFLSGKSYEEYYNE